MDLNNGSIESLNIFGLPDPQLVESETKKISSETASSDLSSVETITLAENGTGTSNLERNSGFPEKSTSKTIISAVIDRSGSMSSMWAETVRGFKNYLEEQREVSGEAVYSLRMFDDKQTMVYSFVNAAYATGIPENVRPRGFTALNDAIGQEIRRIRGFQVSHPGYDQVVVLIMTDGEENASREFRDTAGIRNLVEECTLGGWEFIFIGANINAFSAGRQFGISNAIQSDRRSLPNSFGSASRSAIGYRAFSRPRDGLPNSFESASRSAIGYRACSKPRDEGNFLGWGRGSERGRGNSAIP